MAESLQFSATIDDSQIQQKLNALPAAAAKSGEKMGEGVQKGFEAGVRKASSGAASVKARAGAFMAAGSATDAQRAADRKENERAQLYLDQLQERNAKKEEQRIARLQNFERKQKDQFLKETEQKERKMDDAKARTRAQRREIEANKPREGIAGLSDRVGAAATAGIPGAAAVYGIYKAAKAISDVVQSIRQTKADILERRTASQEQIDLYRSSQRESVGASSRQDVANVSEAYRPAIEKKVKELTNEEYQQGGIEHAIDRKVLEPVRAIMKATGFGNNAPTTYLQDRKSADKSQIDALKAQRAMDVKEAMESSQRITDLNDRETAGERLKGLDHNEKGLTIHQRGVRDFLDELQERQNNIGDLSDENNAAVFQTLQAKINSLLPVMKEATSQFLAQRDAQRQLLLPSKKLVDIESEQLLTRQRLYEGKATPEEKAMLRERQSGLEMESERTKKEVFFSEVQSGLMGANSRRDLMRQHRREQNEIDRQHRMRGESWTDRNHVFHTGSGRGKNARAFSDEAVNPKRGILAESDKMASNILTRLGDIYGAIKELVPHPHK